MAHDSKHVAMFSAKHLQPNERVVAWGEGYIGEMMGKGEDAQHNGALIITDSRAAFYRKGFFGEVIETIPLKSITSIERKSFMGHRSIRMHTSHDSLEFKTFKKDKEQALFDAIEAGRSGSASPAPRAPVAEPGGGDTLAALSKLGELKAAGVLTEEEFSAKKAELLSRL